MSDLYHISFEILLQILSISIAVNVYFRICNNATIRNLYEERAAKEQFQQSYNELRQYATNVINAQIAHEREACARIADAKAALEQQYGGVTVMTAEEIAAAIRARGIQQVGLKSDTNEGQ